MHTFGSGSPGASAPKPANVMRAAARALGAGPTCKKTQDGRLHARPVSCENASYGASVRPTMKINP